MDLEEYRRKQEKENPTENEKENAFDNLVFPDDGLDRKTIVRSLVAQHFRDKESGIGREEQSDIVRGKGEVRRAYYIYSMAYIYRRERFDHSPTRSTGGGQDNYSWSVTLEDLSTCPVHKLT